jgi:molybdopterin converting factor small subunit
MRVVLFAALRELAGAPRLDLELAPPTVGSLLEHLANAYGPEFERIASIGSVVVDGEAVGPDRALRPDDEVAILPPVSGGA